MTPRWVVPTAFVFALLGSVSAHAETKTITVENMALSPASVTAKVGDTIEWVNKDAFAHTATAANKDWDVALAPKQSGKFTATKAGAVDYACKFHPNMKGRVTVAP
jgi:plastocyanin